MHVVIAFFIGMALLNGFIPIQEIPKDEVVLPASLGSKVKIRKTIKPFTEFQDERMIKQSYDYSCGSSALATILNYHLGEKFNEKQVIQGLLRYGDAQKISQRRAFSLLDMKKFVNKLGYKGVGYKAKIDDLKTLDKPGIIPIVLFGYRHFTVLKGIYKGHIFLIDPWRGHTSYSLNEFKKMWFNNVVFMIYSNNEKNVLSCLKLREDDLRFIDEDAAKDIINSINYSFSKELPEIRKVYDVQGEYQVYKK